MKKLYVSLLLLGSLMFGIGLANVPILIKSAIAGACTCPQGCPCSHCAGKSKDCKC
ncbi:MAG: hypothetical protein KGJ87_10035 [Planctomycetota bacterium]|nr:hypothetical protein [Planctomycetota bacterium]MDE2217481.1 hypothetical protein [Planctomycetota bacterium]